LLFWPILESSMKAIYRKNGDVKITHIALGGAAAIFILIGASIWEGSAAVAPGGVLPAAGYYAATNSFPRNTIVNVINLENGKTVQVTVSAGLDNAGLLILLSKDAAEAIGIQGQRTGRVRIMEPADPIAFSPFTEGRTSNGDPDHDPNAQIAATPPSPQVVPPVENPLPVASSSEVVDIPDDYVPPASAAATPDPAYIADPVPPADTVAADTPIPASSAEDVPATIAEPPFDTVAADTAIDASSAEDVLAAIAEPPFDTVAADTAMPASSVEDVPASIAEPPFDTVAANTPVPASSVEDIPVAAPSADTTVPVAEHSLDGFDLALVPTENRPPTGQTASLPADAEVAPITLPPTPAAPAEKNPDPSAFVGAIEPQPAAAKAQPAPFNGFSVPVISQFEKGKYYVQLRSYAKPELVESELVKVGKSLPVAVQAADVSGQKVYRVIIGPVSKSDSQALLQQFKNKGWTDAFVWLGL
jgi:hypothetical protein